MLSKVDMNKRIKKEALLESAYSLFATKGVEKTSILEIALHAGVAKGTFYLYYADKYSIRDALVMKRSQEIFSLAMQELKKEKKTDFTEIIIFIANYILDYLNSHKDIVKFIHKNLSWALFKSALLKTDELADGSESFDFRKIYYELIEASKIKFKDPEIMLFMIVELIGASCDSIILEGEPISLEEYKPHLFCAISAIIQSQIMLH